MPKSIVLASVLALLLGSVAKADLEMVPDSRHQLFTSYAFFTDPQNNLLWRSGNRAWGEIGGEFPIFDLKGWRWNPQFLVFGSASAGYYISVNDFTLKTQTIDARVGFDLDLEFSPEMRLEVGVKHESGHISDDVPDATLIGPNLGNEIAHFRFFYDYDNHFRVGGTFKPVLSSAPRLKVFGADQFAEWFPWGQAGPHEKSYYVSMALEEIGVDHIVPTFEAQVGILWGNHFNREHKFGFRVVAGYYNGIDPRLKYAQYMASVLQFGYAGAAFDF